MDHKDLEVWKKSIDMVIEIYRLSDVFPKSSINPQRITVH